MNTRKFKYLLNLAMSVGMKTVGDLFEYKTRNKLRTNEDLIRALYSDKMRAQ